MARQRLYDIDRAKGLAIFLVVFGHLFTTQTYPGDPAWYFALRRMTYTFHMSFFMFLSGFVMFYTYRPIITIQNYKTYIAKRFWRLMPAYVLFSLIVMVVKLAGQNVTEVNNALNSASDIINIFITPSQSFSRFMWYIYVIFIFYAVIPPLLTISRQKLWPLLCFGFGLYFLPRTNLFAINLIESYFVIFVLGGMLITHKAVYEQWLDKWGAVAFVLFLGSLALVDPLRIMPYPVTVAPLRLVVGLLSIPALHWLVRLKWVSQLKVLLVWGKYTFPIYLMNTIAIGGTKAFFPSITTLNDWGFLGVFIVTLFVGVYGPIAVKAFLFPRLPALDRITA